MNEFTPYRSGPSHSLEMPPYMIARNDALIEFRNAEYWNDETAKWARRVSVALCAVVIAAAVVSGLGLAALQLTYGDGALEHIRSAPELLQ